MLVSQEELEEAFRLLDEGKASFRDLESKLGISKSTLQRWYAKRLERIIEERRRALADLEEKFSRLQMEYSTLKNKYEEESRVLEEEYSKKRKSLEGEIGRLKKDYEIVKASFERQGISWDEGIAIVAEIASLREERERLKGEVSRCQNMLNQIKLDIQMFLEEDQRLQRSVSSLRWAYSSYMEWFKREAPKLEQCKSQLQQSIKKLEDQKLKLTEEIAGLQRAKANLQASLKALEDERARLMREIDELESEAEDLAQRIVADAEERRKRILHEIEYLEKEREKIRAEKDLLECAVKYILRQL
ncbi:MAG: hypothetical protein QW707_06040 [Candidatus Bathyarchaeia archaeon]